MEVSINRIPLINQAFSKGTLQELQEWFHKIVNEICTKEQPETVEPEEEYKAQEFYEDVLDCGGRGVCRRIQRKLDIYPRIQELSWDNAGADEEIDIIDKSKLNH